MDGIVSRLTGVIQMTTIDVTLLLRLDKDEVRELGLNDAVEAGDEVQLMAVAKVTKAMRNLNGPGPVELKIVEIGVREVERIDEPEEPMADYAKRRNEE